MEVTPLRDSGKYSRGYFLRRGPAAEIGRARAVRKRLFDGPFEIARGAGVSQVLDQQRSGQYRRDRIGDAFAGEWRGRAVHRLEQSAVPPRMQVGARGDAEPAHQSGTQVGENV